jgi:hypothetical protein
MSVANTAWMCGLFGVRPNYSNMTGPSGETCLPTGGSPQIKYNNVSVQSAQAALDAFCVAHPSGFYIWTYSESTDAAILHLNAHPEDLNTYVLFGSPSDPDGGNTSGSFYALTNLNCKLTFCTMFGDSVARPHDPGASLAIHTSGYNGVDFRTSTESFPLSTTVFDNHYGVKPT